MHANAFLPVNKGFALVFNPTSSELTQDLVRARRVAAPAARAPRAPHAGAHSPSTAPRVQVFPLYYTGITGTANFAREGGAPVPYVLERDYSVTVSVTLPAQAVTWYLITDADAGGSA